MTITKNNYFSPKAEMEYVTVSQIKAFCGTPAKVACEASALAELKGEYKRNPTTALMIGSYVDNYFSGTLDEFKDEHPEIISSRGKTAGELKTEYRQAEAMIARAERDELFMKYLEGDKQVPLVGEIEGVPFKILIDSTDHRRITDLKTLKSISETYYVKDSGERVTFIENWNYDLQGAAYQYIYEQNFGKKLPFYIAAISKDKDSDGTFHPRIAVIQIPQGKLDERLVEIKRNVRKIQMIKSGEIEPIHCGHCHYCADTLPLDRVISSDELLLDI